MYASRRTPPRGYTLLQLIVAVGIIAMLMATAVKTYAIARSGALSSACASKLKVLAMDLERYYADHKCYPTTLGQLFSEYVPEPSAFHCPEDIRPEADTYSDSYVLRHAKERDSRPLLLSCPMHQDAGRGVQVFLGGHESGRGQTVVAKLTEGGGGVMVLGYDFDRPEDAEPTDDDFWNGAVAAAPGMDVGPGDWLRVPSGEATLSFRDGSRARMIAPTELMVVDVFREVSESAQHPFYTMLRLARGQVVNTVVNSRYEVVAPTGTAGAKGTEFLVEYIPDPGYTPPGKGKGKAKGLWKRIPKGKAETHVYKGEVYFHGRYTSADLKPGQAAAVTEDGIVRKIKQKPKP